MRIAYGKLGRSFTLSTRKSSSVGGDIEVVNLLNHLRQDHEVHLVGPNRHDERLSGCVQYWGDGDPFDGLPIVGDANRFPDDPVYLKFMEQVTRVTNNLPEFDAWVIWIGQHGTTSSFVPRVSHIEGRDDPRLAGLTAPLMSLINYAYPVVHMVNDAHRKGHKVIWLCPDPRNLLKARDIEDNVQDFVLAQYNQNRNNKFWSKEYGQRTGVVRYRYAGVEMLALNRDVLNEDAFHHAISVPRPLSLGILVNEGYHKIAQNRRMFIERWFRDMEYEIFGHWSNEGMRFLKRLITTVPLADVTKTLQRWRATMTFPATGTGWATAKPWECFAAGTICFRHVYYDDQQQIYGRHMNSELRDFLSPNHPDVLRQRVELLQDDRVYRYIAERQFNYLRQSLERLNYGYSEVERRLEHAFNSRRSPQVLRGEEEVLPVRDDNGRGDESEAGTTEAEVWPVREDTVPGGEQDDLALHEPRAIGGLST